MIRIGFNSGEHANILKLSQLDIACLISRRTSPISQKFAETRLLVTNTN